MPSHEDLAAPNAPGVAVGPGAGSTESSRSPTLTALTTGGSQSPDGGQAEQRVDGQRQRGGGDLGEDPGVRVGDRDGDVEVQENARPYWTTGVI